ncbi:MAG: FHA domain-containing protein [Lachnospiraceae bacterium]|nr:FHA domain-containing protein [Lachnospiraceae bacterium]
MKKRAGKRIRLFTAAICMMLLAAAMHITAFAEQEEKVFVILGYDASGEAVSYGLGYYVQDSGEDYMLSDISAYDEDVTEYYAYATDSDSSSSYELVSLGESVASILFFEFADDTPSSSYLVSLGYAEEDQTVNWLFLTSEIEVDSARIQLTSAEEVELDGDTWVVLHGDFLEDEPDDIYTDCLPMALIDDDGTMVGLYTSSGYFYSFLDDADSFGTGTASSGDSSDEDDQTEQMAEDEEETDSDNGTTDSDNDRIIREGKDDPIEEEEDFPIMLIVIIVIIAAAVVVVLAVLLTRKKKQPGDNIPPGGVHQEVEPVMGPQKRTETIPQSDEEPVTMILEPDPVPQDLIPRQMSITGIAGAMMGRTYPVGSSVVSMGRDVPSTIRFAPDTKGISREHCRLFPDGQGNLMLMDCGSSYGTFLTGYGKLQPQKPVPVKDGDRFYLGSDANGFTVHIQ